MILGYSDSNLFQELIKPSLMVGLSGKVLPNNI